MGLICGGKMRMVVAFNDGVQRSRAGLKWRSKEKDEL